MITKTLFTVVMLLLTGYASLASPLCAQERKNGEYEVKAAFIYNIGKFIEWPEKPGEKSDCLTLGLLGNDHFEKHLDVLQGKKLRGKKIIVKRFASVHEAKNCHILFIAGSEKTRINLILKELATKPILTVGDTDSFAEKGVMINFYIDNNKVRFAINNEAAKRANVRIHSNLLTLGKIVSP